jgi:Type II secretion system (T2SS), protein K
MKIENHQRRLHSKPSKPPRRAMVLVIVLVVIAVLTLASYTFSELMLTEHQATRVVARQAQARALAESGAEMVRIFVQQTSDAISQAGGTYDNATQFQGVVVYDDGTSKGRGRFSVVAPRIENGSVTGVRFGLENESARLNINALAALEQQKPGVGKQLLMALPGMDDATSDAILDWLDADDDPRPNGAESSYYSGLNPPYMPKNGPLDTIEELLLVRGVTPQLLFGADANRNGFIDAGEQKLPQIADSANADPETNRGWAAYLTLYGKESNLQPDDTLKFDLNSSDLQGLHDDLASVFSDEWVNFIIAYRLYGGTTPPATSSNGGSGTPSSSGSSSGTTPMNSAGGPYRNNPLPDSRQVRSPFQLVALLQAPGGGGGGGGGGGRGGGGGGGGGQGGGGGGGRGGAGPGAAGGGGGGGGGRGGGGGGGRGGGGGGRGGQGGGGRGGGRGGPGGGAQGGRQGGGRTQGGRQNNNGNGSNGSNGTDNSEEMTADQIPAELLDLTKQGSHKFTSVLDLVGVIININPSSTTSGTSTTGGTGTTGGNQQSQGNTMAQGNSGTQSAGAGTGTGTTNGQQKPIKVTAAFPDDPSQAGQYLPQLLDHVTVANSGTVPPAFPGRININQASKTILLGVPGMTSDIIDQIVSSREPEFTGQHPEQQYETWLYTQGIVPLTTMKELQPFITTGGSVFRGQIVGFFDDGGPSHRVEVVVDSSPVSADNAVTLTSPNTANTTDPTATQGTSGTDPSSSSGSSTGSSSSTSTTTTTTTQPVIGVPRILFWRDISHLGRGFSLDTLMGN